MNTNIAWLAGIMEGEGSFFIAHQQRSQTDQIRATITMSNTDPGLVNKALQVFEEIGTPLYLHEYKNKKGSTRPVFEMSTAQQSKVKTICEALIPYMFGEKKAKAEILLRFVNNRLAKGKGNYDSEDWQVFRESRSSTTTREAAAAEDIV